MQKAIGAVYRTTSRLAWVGSRSYCYGADTPGETRGPGQGQGFEKSVNKVTLLGRIGSDPFFATANQFEFSNFSLATSNVYTVADTNEVKQHTTWHQIKVTRPHIISSLRDLGKGSRVYIEGKLEARSFIDKEGNKRDRTNVVVENLIVLARKDRVEEYSEN